MNRSTPARPRIVHTVKYTSPGPWDSLLVKLNKFMKNTLRSMAPDYFTDPMRELYSNTIRKDSMIIPRNNVNSYIPEFATNNCEFLLGNYFELYSQCVKSMVWTGDRDKGLADDLKYRMFFTGSAGSVSVVDMKVSDIDFPSVAGSFYCYWNPVGKCEKLKDQSILRFPYYMILCLRINHLLNILRIIGDSLANNKPKQQKNGPSNLYESTYSHNKDDMDKFIYGNDALDQLLHFDKKASFYSSATKPMDASRYQFYSLVERIKELLSIHTPLMRQIEILCSGTRLRTLSRLIDNPFLMDYLIGEMPKTVYIDDLPDINVEYEPHEAFKTNIQQVDGLSSSIISKWTRCHSVPDDLKLQETKSLMRLTNDIMFIDKDKFLVEAKRTIGTDGSVCRMVAGNSLYRELNKAGHYSSMSLLLEPCVVKSRSNSTNGTSRKSECIVENISILDMIRSDIYGPLLEQMEEHSHHCANSGSRTKRDVFNRLTNLSMITCSFEEAADIVCNTVDDYGDLAIDTIHESMYHFVPIIKNSAGKKPKVHPSSFFSNDYAGKSVENMLLIEEHKVDRKLVDVNGALSVEKCALYYTCLMRINLCISLVLWSAVWITMIEKIRTAALENREQIVFQYTTHAEKNNLGRDDIESVTSNLGKFEEYDLNLLIKGVHRNDDMLQVLRDLRYQAYSIIHDHIPMLLYMIDQHHFSDERILQYMAGSSYHAVYPYPNRAMSCDKLQCIDEVITRLDYFYESSTKPTELTYLFNKVLPNVCECRYMGYMLKKYYDGNKALAGYINQITECTVLGLYQHANHHELCRDIPFLLCMNRDMYNVSDKRWDRGNDEPGDENPKPGRPSKGSASESANSVFRRSLFLRLSANERVLENLIREQLVHTIDDSDHIQSVFEDVLWCSDPFIPWSEFKSNTVHNCDVLRKYIFSKHVLPTSHKNKESDWKAFMEDDQERTNDINAKIKTLLHLTTRQPFSDSDISISDTQAQLEIIIRYDPKAIPSSITSRIYADDQDKCMEMFLYITETSYIIDVLGLDHSKIPCIHRAKKRGTRKRKHRSVSWITDRQKHRVYDKRFCENIRRSLMTAYSKRYTKDHQDGTSTCDSMLNDPPQAIIDKITNYEKLGLLSIGFQDNYIGIIVWLYEQCGISLSAVKVMLEILVLMYTRKSEERIVKTLIDLSMRDFSVIRFYFAQDQSKSFVYTIQLGIADNVRTLFAIQRKNHSYMNICCASPDLYEPADRTSMYTSGCTKCCDRIVSLSSGMCHGFSNTSDSTPSEYILDPRISHITNDQVDNNSSACYARKVVCCEERAAASRIASETNFPKMRDKSDDNMEIDEEMYNEEGEQKTDETESDVTDIIVQKVIKERDRVIKFGTVYNTELGRFSDDQVAESKDATKHISKSQLKEITNRATNSYRKAVKAHCRTEGKNEVFVFGAFGKLIIEHDKSDHSTMYRFCSECANFSVYTAYLQAGDRFMCSRCWITDPSKCLYIYNDVHKSYAIVNYDTAFCILTGGDIIVDKEKTQRLTRKNVIIAGPKDSDLQSLIHSESEIVPSIINSKLVRKKDRKANDPSDKKNKFPLREEDRALDMIKYTKMMHKKLIHYFYHTFYAINDSIATKCGVIVNHPTSIKRYMIPKKDAAKLLYLMNPEEYTLCRLKNTFDLKLMSFIERGNPIRRYAKKRSSRY